MLVPRQGLKALLQRRIEGEPPTSVWTPRDFTDLGAREAVDKALQRMVGTGELRRIARGLYDRPRFNVLTHKLTPADPQRVIQAIERRDKIRVIVDGMTAANDLGLTTAVPAKIVVHADTRLGRIVLGEQQIVFKPTAASRLFWAGRPAMRLVQALYWLRDMLIREGEADAVHARLRRILEDVEFGRVLRADLADGMSALPDWMQAVLKPLIEPIAT